MSNIPIWGTGIAPAEFALRRRATSDGDVRVTSTGDVRVAFIPAAQVIFGRVTSEGDRRVTSEGDRRVIIQGLLGPAYLQTANVTTDGGERFGFSCTTNPWQPSAQGGENVFAWAFIAISWSMSATIRVLGTTEILDKSGNGLQVVSVPSTFTLEQADGSLQRNRRVLAIPLVRRIVDLNDLVALSRYYLRGERLAITIESTGPLGVGELMLEGAEVDWASVRKADYPGDVDSTP